LVARSRPRERVSWFVCLLFLLIELLAVTGQAPGKFSGHFLRAHDPATGRAIFDRAFAARCFRRATFGRRHPSASAFFSHIISFLLVE
jgi:hypothetical protein